MILSSGCMPKMPLPENHYGASQKIDVPFVSPRSELCAASSIEMLSLYWQEQTPYTPKLTLKELDARTLIPQKGGTLQIELIATARANGLLVYEIEPTFEALSKELLEAHPVIVLLNRSYAWYPLWHYAPITGYDAKTQTIMMHYDKTPHEGLSLATFSKLWERSAHWGVVLLPPTELPASATAQKFTQVAFDFEKIGMREEAIIAYETAITRWPDYVPLLFALANAYHSSNQMRKAEEVYRYILTIDFNYILALNNLADLLCHSGRSNEALSLLDRAVSDDVQMQTLINATHKEIKNGCAPLMQE